MFRTFIYPSSGACDCASTCNTDTTPTQPHRNTHRTKNNTTNVVIQQNSCKLLMDILMSETCWAHKKWNKITSDIKLVFYSTIAMIHCPINIIFYFCWSGLPRILRSRNVRRNVHFWLSCKYCEQALKDNKPTHKTIRFTKAPLLLFCRGYGKLIKWNPIIQSGTVQTLLAYCGSYQPGLSECKLYSNAIGLCWR